MMQPEKHQTNSSKSPVQVKQPGPSGEQETAEKSKSSGIRKAQAALRRLAAEARAALIEKN